MKNMLNDLNIYIYIFYKGLWFFVYDKYIYCMYCLLKSVNVNIECI